MNQDCLYCDGFNVEQCATTPSENGNQVWRCNDCHKTFYVLSVILRRPNWKGVEGVEVTPLTFEKVEDVSGDLQREIDSNTKA